MIIRKVRIEDLDKIHFLTKQLGYEYPIEKMKEKMNKVLSIPDHFINVASVESEIVGLIHVEIYRTIYGDDLLNILGIVVDSSYRKRGIGAFLINSVEEIGLKNNCSGIRANSGSLREEAHFFYRRNGFHSEKNQKRFIKPL